MRTLVTVLTAKRPATKTLTLGEDGAIRKLRAEPAKYFTVERVPIETIYDLAGLLTTLNNSPTSLVIRGEPIPGTDLTKPVRRLRYATDDATATFRSSAGESWLCIDFDKVPSHFKIDAANDPVSALLFLSYLLPPEFHDITFFAQWSSSAGLDGWRTLSAHLWFMLEAPVHDDHLRAWARSCGSPIDYRVFDPVQPHFTAAPVLKQGVADPVSRRHGLIKGERDAVPFSLCRHDVKVAA